MDAVKISVLIICYKQESLIRRAIESLLRQRDYVYEICVSDDCSPDNTWNVLLEYCRMYPGLFKLHRNSSNVGIFENIENTWRMPTGDMIYQLSGDDECGEGWLKAVTEYLLRTGVDYKNERICVYGDYEARYMGGDSFVFSNEIISEGYDPLGLALRKLICNRSACYSKRIIDSFVSVCDGRSYAVESAQDMQLQLFSSANYYIPKVGNIYYTGIGVSVGTNRNGSPDTMAPMAYLEPIIEQCGYHLNKKDRNLFNYFYIRSKSQLDKKDSECSLWEHSKEKIRLPLLLIRSYDFSLGLRQLKLKRLMFAVVRRIPHKNSICWHM